MHLFWRNVEIPLQQQCYLIKLQKTKWKKKTQSIFYNKKSFIELKLWKKMYLKMFLKKQKKKAKKKKK